MCREAGALRARAWGYLPGCNFAPKRVPWAGRMSKPQPAPEVLLSHDVRRPVRRAARARALAGVVTALAGAPACLAAPQGDASTTDVMLGSDTGAVGSTGGSSTQPAIMTTTEEPETTTTPGSGSSGSGSDSSGGSGTTMVDPNCGNGSVDPGEDCDEGAGNSNEGTCTKSCKAPTCGDGYVQAGENCDDAVNDGAYGGCLSDCSARAPYCGDGEIDELEMCDGGKPWAVISGCLPNCNMAAGCRQIRDAFPDNETVVDGLYKILRANKEQSVYCDMTTDGGGYTFVKVSVPLSDPKLSAVDAEKMCKAEYGMRLLVPRTEGHLLAAGIVATSNELAALGGGSSKETMEFLSILGIYPVMPGKSCVGKPLNSEACPEWEASDGGAYWVTSGVLSGQPNTTNCAGCSMNYTWSAPGMLKGYVAESNGEVGFETRSFMCEVGDK